MGTVCYGCDMQQRAEQHDEDTMWDGYGAESMLRCDHCGLSLEDYAPSSGAGCGICPGDHKSFY